MNVLNRKMFANRDARRKLANMGGILASSPELMQTAQMFAPGGQVGSPTAQKVKTVRHPQGFVYDVYTDGRVVSQITGVPLNPNDPTQAALIREVMSLSDMTPTPRPVPKLENNPILNEQEIATESRSMLPIRDNRQELQNTIESGTELVPGVNVPGPSEQYVMDKTSPNYTARDPSEIPELASEFEEETIEKPMPTLLDTDEDYTPTAAELDQQLLDMGAPDKRFDVVPNAIEKIYGGSDTGEVKRGDRRNPVDKSMQKSISEILGIGEETGPGVSATRRKSSKNQQLTNEEQEFEASPTDEEMVTDETLLELEEVATSDATSEEKVEGIREKIFGPGVDSQTAIAQYQTKFNDILGEDRDLNEEKWHTLAMIGFAIAAGEDSNALTNIANGLLEGTKMAREDRATRQARKDKINMLALEQFFADERLDKELGAAETRAQIAAEARTADDTWFDTAPGKEAIAAYRDIFGTQNLTMKPEDRMPAFIKRIGEDNATVFFTLMGIPQENLVQPKERSLDEIPDKKVKKSEQNK
tara:strand:- start:43 stop:1638 length:1596 start_codon:yes stop_codon:yes gene_type:complete